MSGTPSFAAVDWGTSTFRVWLLDAAGDVLAERRSDEGLRTAAERGFARVLETHLEALGADPALPAVVCGMAGSRQGWQEARYLDVPTRLDAIAGNAVRIDGIDRPVHILPGLAQRDRQTADVMRGEETQLLGAMTREDDGTGDVLYCMPGTHSKWVRLRDGTVTGFSTFMTGEVYALMVRESILAQTLGDAMDVDADAPAFAKAVLAAHDEPALLMRFFFALRGSSLLFGEEATVARARLSGYLIGAELAGSLPAERDGAAIRLLASGGLGALYKRALDTLGVTHTSVDADEAVRAGLARAAAAIHPAVTEGAHS
ncbi:2-dehydro-3-deoxygalactonokinase [Pararhizobium mangrovi]|uniref:2-dehydro-3-deoxygalactonokinase n=1 Tax=Pararhizobium mangrovi TaxID=2590452 RepID=A0A506U659_9HYPH|nr:2-dehydro-3-deoxygalactonokinase [Pararhizobium mangrovi]TPW27407.1 2-dehydro-3-deoxygalactonokinase [Pararhizobium mangrovi]